MTEKINGFRFILGHTCNYNCFYCHHEGYHTLNEEKINLEKFYRLADYIEENEIYDISITGGEPFLYSEMLFTILNRFNDKKFRITLNTNLSLLHNYIDEICKLNPIEFHVNFSSLKSTVHKDITNTTAFSDVIKNLDLLSKTHHKICLNMIVLNDFNEREMLSMLKFCKKHNYHPRFLVVLTEDNNLKFSKEEMLNKIPGSKVLKKYSYGRYDVTSDVGVYEIVECLCNTHECERCRKTGYIHLTPTLDIKYCMECEKQVKLDVTNNANIEKSLTKAIRKWGMIK